jgi:zinc protease
MTFKGTKKLSETDINLISYKLTGYVNAFTSPDATCYIFRLPSHVWHYSLEILSDCMNNVSFRPYTLASEIKAIVEEFHLYRDDYQTYLIEQIVRSIWPEHPYNSPIIGSLSSIGNTTRETILNFYKKHYNPKNSTLVIVGDVKLNKALKLAQKNFEHIKAPQEYIKQKYLFTPEVMTQKITLYRNITTPWSCFVYQLPGSQEGKNYLYDITGLILANNRSSRLYTKLVHTHQLAIDIDCSINDFFDATLFIISVYPKDLSCLPQIEKIINEELEKFTKDPIENWEFESAKKRVYFDYSVLCDNISKQALLIGNYFLATRDQNFIEKYKEEISTLKSTELQKFFAQYFIQSKQHQGHLVPASSQEIEILKTQINIQANEEQKLLKKYKRVRAIDKPMLSKKISIATAPKFKYPKPKTFKYNNGLELIYYNNKTSNTITILLAFKVDPLYDPDDKNGLLSFLLRVLTEETSKYTVEEFSKLCETNGVYISSSNEIISVSCTPKELEKSLEILAQIVTSPAFNTDTIEKIRARILNEISEFWDTPIEFIDQKIREALYEGHPYSKNPLGTLASVTNITQEDLKNYYSRYITPQGATLVISGNLEHYKITQCVKKYFDIWAGPKVPKLIFPKLKSPKAQEILIPFQKDQVVIALAAHTINRFHKDYLALALIDIVLTGGAAQSSNSRLFEIREKTGLFYNIGGSLVYGAREEPGLMYIKTLVTPDKVKKAKKLIIDALEKIKNQGLTQEEFLLAKNLFISSSIELFESNSNIAYAFLFLKKFNLGFNLFDKQGELLSIISRKNVNKVSQKYCNINKLVIINVGRYN